jgi:NAD-dependent oxidoreductase involved in siderophore biosynthesis
VRRLAQQQGKRTAVELFGSLKNMAQRLLESLRNLAWPDEAFSVEAAKRMQVRLDTS